MKSKLEDNLSFQIKYAIKIPFERQFKFHPTRKWRSDIAFPDRKLLIEIDGGLYVNGGHNRGAQIEKDMEKSNEAVLMGYAVLRFSEKMINSGWALAVIEDYLKKENE